MVDFGRMLLGFGLLTFGALGARYGYQLSRIGERLDAIGSTTPMYEVEPTNWNVVLTQLAFGILGAVGALMVILSVLQP